jgi:hypothetical protein
MSKTICELKIELKAKGIKGISGLNKSGLEALLKGGKSAPKKEVSKAKPFTPAPTKGDTPVVAEKQIDKKIKPPKVLMLTYKPKKESKPKTKSMIFNEKYKDRIEGFMKSPRDVLLKKREKVKALMIGGGTDAEKKQATTQYEILNEAITRQIMKE